MAPQMASRTFIPALCARAIFAQTTSPTMQAREEDQQARIAQGVRSGGAHGL
jgi:hypothetical protein